MYFLYSLTTAEENKSLAVVVEKYILEASELFATQKRSFISHLPPFFPSNICSTFSLSAIYLLLYPLSCSCVSSSTKTSCW